MAADAELAAIIGGSVAGAVVLIAIVALIVCLCCGKRRRHKDGGEHKKKTFQQLSPHTSPSHSQPSSLGHGGVMPPHPNHPSHPQHPPGAGGDPRLPKVGSNGLWLGTPGIYASTPSPAYYYGRPGGKPPHHPHHYPQFQHAGGAVLTQAGMQRASSESRIPQQRDRHVPPGPGVYAGPGGGSQQRIYHSQQLAAMTPLYEVVDPRNGSIYDVYQIGGGSKTKLLQDSRGSKSGDRPHGNSKKAHRTQSDATRHDPSSSKRPHRHRGGSQEGQHGSSKTGSVTKETAQVHQPRGDNSHKPEGGVTNAAFVGSSEKIAEAVKTSVVGSATDSMKILAKNKTDDQKKVVDPSSSSSSSSSDSSSDDKQPSSTQAPEPDPTLHYTFGGDIYAVPDKEENKRRSRSENPILARMQDMILERAEVLESGRQAPDPVTDLTESREPYLVTSPYSPVSATSSTSLPRDGDHHGGASLIQNPIYQEVEEVLPENRSSDPARTSAVDSADLAAAMVAAAASRSAVDELDGGGLTPVSGADRVSAPASGDVSLADAAASSAVTSLREAGGRGERAESGRQEDGDDAVVKGSLEPRWSMDTDAATDEISRAGKHISETAEAFGFLDTYLSDEDCADTPHSPPISPDVTATPSSGVDELMY